MSQITTDSSFEADVINSKLPVLVDFWATWCNPCRIQAPILDEVSEDLKNQAKIVKVDVDENPESAQKYGVMSIPTLMFFKDGKIVKQVVGVQSKDVLVNELKKMI